MAFSLRKNSLGGFFFPMPPSARIACCVIRNSHLIVTQSNRAIASLNSAKKASWGIHFVRSPWVTLFLRMDSGCERLVSLLSEESILFVRNFTSESHSSLSSKSSSQIINIKRKQPEWETIQSHFSLWLFSFHLPVRVTAFVFFINQGVSSREPHFTHRKPRHNIFRSLTSTSARETQFLRPNPRFEGCNSHVRKRPPPY